MNNKTIIIGYVNLDWHFAKGAFSCKYAVIEDTNTFDRAICGILYRSKRKMLKSELATILGFNIVNNPSDGRFCDRSEEAIFDYAIESLIEYGLITYDSNYLCLTDSGNESFTSRTKKRIETEDVELCVDEFSRQDFRSEMITGIPYKIAEDINQPAWNILSSSPMEVLKSQKDDFSNTQERRYVVDIKCIAINYYVANLHCKICYNLETQKLFALSSMESAEIDQLLMNNSLLQNKLLDSFFASQKPSVIFKPAHQIEKENIILNLETGDTSDDRYYIIHKKEFLKKLNKRLVDDKVSILFFSLYEINNEVIESFKNLNSDIICVDYVKGPFELSTNDDNCTIDNNICYYHLDELRTNDICVFGDSIFSSKPYVIDYKGTNYSIALLYEYDDNIYNKPALYSPFVNHILETIIINARNVLDRVKNNPSLNDVKNISSLFDDVCKMISFDQSTSTTIDKLNTIQTLIKQIFDLWYNSLHDRLSGLESEIVAGLDKESARIKLKDIEADADATIINEDLNEYISEIKLRLSDYKDNVRLSVKSQNIYILDTSVFMEIPKVLERFDLSRDKVIIPRAMEQELDGLTHDPEKKANATMARLLIRRKKDDYPHFLKIKDDVDRSLLPTGFDPNKNDNDMLASAIELENNDKIEKVIIVSNDMEFVNNIKDCVDSNIISNRIEGINLDELLIRLDG